MTHSTDLVDALRDRLSAVRAPVADVPVESRDALEQALPDALGRLVAIFDHWVLLLSATPSELVTDSMANNLQQVFSMVESAFTNFASNPAAYAATFHQAVDQLAAATVAWAGLAPLSKTTATQVERLLVGGLERAVDRTEAAASRIEKRLEESDRVREARIAESDAALQTETARLSTEMAALRTQISSEQTRLDQLTTQYQQQFAEAQERRSTEFEQLRAQAQADTQEAREHFTSEAQETLDRLERIRAQAQDVANAVANTGTATAYGSEARVQRRAANIWRFIAVGFGVLAALSVLITLEWSPGGQSLSVPSVAGRLAFAVILAGVASYAVSQSSDHRRREQHARRLELELTAFTPFIENLNEQDREEVRKAFVDRLFKGAEYSDASHAEDSVLSGDQISLLARVVDIITKR
jgi:hypothetical protein